MAGKRRRRWIRGAVKRPGRVHAYLSRLYGTRAFNADGTIKAEYLDRAIARAGREGNASLVRALNLAKNLKRIARKRRTCAPCR